jgi:hypothetical protein
VLFDRSGTGGAVDDRRRSTGMTTRGDAQRAAAVVSLCARFDFLIPSATNEGLSRIQPPCREPEPVSPHLRPSGMGPAEFRSTSAFHKTSPSNHGLSSRRPWSTWHWAVTDATSWIISAAEVDRLGPDK